MPHDTDKLRRDALAIWQAGVDAVRSDVLVQRHVSVRDRRLRIAGQEIELAKIGRIAVVGAGKAGAGMAAGLEQALGDAVLQEKHLSGWINVPADCVRNLKAIHLHPARPAGVNLPTAEGIAGSREIMRLAASLEKNDLCIALISGGGSALLPYPLEPLTLEDKLAVTSFLSAAGAPIDDLNTVRKQLSQIKGGKLAQACGAGMLVALVISDVLGDPLDLIGSGPTVEDRSTPAEALAILERYGAHDAEISPRVFEILRRPASVNKPPHCRVINLVIGNNRTAVDAAAARATQLGYRTHSQSAARSEGHAEDIGRELADQVIALREQSGPQCLVSGGEPTVKLVASDKRGRGGRNQQLVLAAGERLQSTSADDWLILSGGTDGEDGPTDAAGAWIDRETLTAAQQKKLDPGDYLKRNDAYYWFEPLEALIKTGPTHTNVCDVRVVLTR